MESAVITPFGKTASGKTVYQITLQNGEISCDIITFGAALRTLLVPDRDGNPVDVVLGYDTLEQYLTEDGYLGATIGRVANRIAGGQFHLNGRTYTLPLNDGPNHLHGGSVGFSHRVWSMEEATASSVTLSLTSPDGEEGYPGNLKAVVAYSLRGSSLVIRYQAETDQDTLCSLTNHSYFNLSGHDTGNVLDQNIFVSAHEYTPSDHNGIPSGMIDSVENTPMDFRELCPIGLRIDDEFQQLKQAGGYDHNYVIRGAPGTLRSAAIASSSDTGIMMAVDTTMPGMHLYTANYVNEGRVGKGGCLYGPRHAFCLETQFYPDAPHHPNFPSPVLKAGEIYSHTTVFHFSI